MTTGNAQLPPWAVHVFAALAGLAVYYANDAEFMSLFPHWVAVVAHPAVAFATYAGITQIQTREPK